MDLSSVKLDHYRLPGRAGELQVAGAVQQMLAELGDNYASYHHQIADDFERHGGFPDAREFEGDFDGYAAAMDYAVDVLRAERFLRIAHAWRREGMPLGKTGTAGVPLVDERHRLVDRTNDASKRASRRGNPKLAGWSPPAPPRIMDLGG
jgi:hypothetical protein